MHIVIWRLYHPKRQILTLYALFLIFPILLHFLIYIFDVFFTIQNATIRNVLLLNIGELLELYLLHYALSLAYIFTYPAAQGACPSFLILLIIKSSMPRGITKDAIHSYYLDKKLFIARVHDLMDENLVVDNNGWLEMTSKGYLLLKIFVSLRKMFSLPIGKG